MFGHLVSLREKSDQSDHGWIGEKADGDELLLRERHKVVFDKRVYTENISYNMGWSFGQFERKK